MRDPRVAIRRRRGSRVLHHSIVPSKHNRIGKPLEPCFLSLVSYDASACFWPWLVSPVSRNDLGHICRATQWYERFGQRFRQTNDTTPARRRRRASRHTTPPPRRQRRRRRASGTMREEPKPLQRYAHKHKQALWPLTITACLIGGAGVFELLRVFAATPWCRPICYIMVGFTLALKAFSVHVANEGGPIALLPTPLKRWLLTTSVLLDAASEVAMLVDFQHWIGVFIHAIQMLRLDSHEREEILHKLGPTIRRWATRPGLLRAIRPLHDALVWEEDDSSDDEVPVARPISNTEDLDARRRGLRRGRREDQPLVDIGAHFIYKSLPLVAGEFVSLGFGGVGGGAGGAGRCGFDEAGPPAPLAAGVLAHRPDGWRRGGGGALCCVSGSARRPGPEGHNDPSSPVPERSSGALVKAGALAAVVFSVFGGLRSPGGVADDVPVIGIAVTGSGLCASMAAILRGSTASSFQNPCKTRQRPI